ncbi:L-type lectin-domain containing receptor kinase IV.2 [Vitis vinifera]|uniref:L-type lectin-domain containing receptor kinase IV.2 n=1 Tax=Vitis vinifera TaxID=29760 RepID=A0A438E374_VITVI|nr:L-type lectin-domain containing receptor kinase IV.2 [Vitis vinifera]
MVLNEYMHIGFSASTGLLTAAHNVHGWSFRIGGRAADLDPLRLPSPVTRSRKVLHQRGLTLGIILASATLVILVISGTAHVVHRIRNKEEILEEWEVEYGAHRFKYSDLFSATRGFREKNLIGSGGFGRVYKGIIPEQG